MNKQLHRRLTLFVKPIELRITPYALARISDDFHKCSTKYKPTNFFPLTNYFLYLRSIELGMKAVILSKSCTKKDKDFIKLKIGHDLVKLVKSYKNKVDKDVLSTKEEGILRQINGFYKSKGLEYFTIEMIMSAARAYKNLPEIREVRDISIKINKLIRNNKYFINY